MTDRPAIHPPLTTGLILDRTFALLRQNAARPAVAVIAMTVPAVAADLGWGGDGLFFLVNVVTFVAQYWLTAALLDELGLRETSRARFPAFFWLGILSGLGIILGVILLVIPGVILMVRWSIAGPAVIATDGSAVEAMSYSWRETVGHFWPILAAFLTIWAATAAGVAAGYLLEWNGMTEVGAPLFELSLNVGLIVGWHAATAIYAETRRESRYTEVFV
jgi:hypothetical protein